MNQNTGSIGPGEKINKIRENLKMTRERFASELGVSADTVKSIETKPIIPRANIYEKIAARWPEFGNFLLHGERNVGFMIISKIDARWIEKIEIHHESYEKLTLIQDRESRYLMYGLIELENIFENTALENFRRGLLIDTMSLEGGRRGLRYMETFREFIEKNRRDLIDDAEIFEMSSDEFATINSRMFIDKKSLCEITNSETIEKFNNWKNAVS
ncbi:helix-turn-helix transcriptional regulator [Thalassolituus sp.]|jgi:transcriptional regulator with XRE-family HTH domain|uniref:helix-turn-helix domain-containing protein n=1 Tax=Thalassolituus sp. TaxID=2030822 RepID=UPI002A83C0BD|nr:helix-turn-helix transcriptional regulator [Thalassolituus sp.]